MHETNHRANNHAEKSSFFWRSRYLYPVFAAACLAWLILRSGRKPSRLRYPCQRAAALHSAWLIPAIGAWLSGSLRPARSKRLVVPLLLALLIFMAVGLCGGIFAGAGCRNTPDIKKARARAASLKPATWNGSASDGKHDVFVVNHVPRPTPGDPHHAGVDALLRLLSEGGVKIYRSSKRVPCAATDGLIAQNDIVLLKVNAAWDERGETNSDVVKGLITAVLEHPDGFKGEVVIVENCEGGLDYNQVNNNAEDIHQSWDTVVNSFGDRSRVSSSSWWSFTDNRVGEYDTGDMRQGYVWLGNNVAYPKFTTGRGTRVSLRNGSWTGSRYDKSRLKLINIPVLKSHDATGTTACLKNYMGVQSTHMTTNVHSDLINGGFMGRLMNQTMYPCLNLLDATWISPSHPDGLEGRYSQAVRTDTLLAGVDPAAVDYYASKNVLLPVSGYGRNDPDTPFTENTNPYHDGTKNTGYPYNAFRIMLDSTVAQLWAGGHDVTCDPGRIAVHARDMRSGQGWTGGHCATGVARPATTWYFAEGSTQSGFDEWVSLLNPGGGTAHAVLTFTTGKGKKIAHKVDIGARSRKSVHANEVVGAGEEVSCTVTSDIPVVAERQVYFAYKGARTGGHDVVGATLPEKTWYFAEGYTGPGFEQYVCVLNPGGEPAHLTFRFQTQEKGEIVRKPKPVAAHSRSTFNINELLGPDLQSSLKLESDRPVVAERPMYFDYLGTGDYHWDGGHCVMGSNTLSKDYYFAEGTTRDSFEEWLTLENPNSSAIKVQAAYQPAGGQGPVTRRTYTVDPGRRYTVEVAREVGRGKDVSVKLSSSRPFLAERPMYFSYPGDGAGWTGGHCVIGVPSPTSECFFSEGRTGEDFKEWLCLENTSDREATVDVTYYTEEAGVLPPKTVHVPAGTRVTVSVNDQAGNNLKPSCSLRVKRGPAIVAERAMYFDYTP